MKPNQLNTHLNQVSVREKRRSDVKMFVKTFFVLLTVFLTFSSFKTNELRTNPYPFYAFTMFPEEFTDLNGHAYGSIEVDFWDPACECYLGLDSPIFANVYTSTTETGAHDWDSSAYCYDNPYTVAHGVPMYNSWGQELYSYAGPSANGDYIPQNP